MTLPTKYSLKSFSLKESYIRLTIPQGSLFIYFAKCGLLVYETVVNIIYAKKIHKIAHQRVKLSEYVLTFKCLLVEVVYIVFLPNLNLLMTLETL